MVAAIQSVWPILALNTCISVTKAPADKSCDIQRFRLVPIHWFAYKGEHQHSTESFDC